jgi:hypothetical protein
MVPDGVKKEQAPADSTAPTSRLAGGLDKLRRGPEISEVR